MATYKEKTFRLTNTKTWKREEFKPQNPPKVLYYSCGPTVYGLLHIGNARSLIFSDHFYRWLKYIGYDVNYVRNYTDVDDKIIKRAMDEGVSADEISKKYIATCEAEIKELGLLDPTKVVLVTETMPEIISMIEQIIKNKHAYVVDGEVLYAIDSFKTYGKLSHKNPEELEAGARVEVDKKKRNPLDFALWKPAKEGEPSWDSPWGKGRPGWHIECSAMASRWLGKTIDVHHGGQDLIFPHHENEIAQSEAASGQEFCKHWVHHAFLTMSATKMSKSLGNLLTTEEFLKIYGPELLKYIYVSHHFRSTIDFSDQMLQKANDELERVYLAKQWAEKSKASDAQTDSGNGWKSLDGKVAATFEKMEDELFADLNMPGALGHLFSLIRDINRTESSAPTNTKEKQKVATEFLDLIEKKLNPLFNVFGQPVDDALANIEKVRKTKVSSDQAMSDEQINALVDERNAARKNKDFKRADEIRDDLLSKGIAIIDSPTGTTWKYK